MTGGGQGPTLPQDVDGDEVENDLNLNELDGVDTNWNTLVRPGDRRLAGAPPTPPPVAVTGIRWASSGVRLQAGSSSGLRFPASSSPGPRFPASFSTRFPSSSLLGIRFPATPSGALNFSGTPPRPIGLRTLGNPAFDFSPPPTSTTTPANVSPCLGTEMLSEEEAETEVVLRDENGEQYSVEIVQEETPRPTNKKPKKKNMNDEAGNYYSTMLEIQKPLFAQKMKILKRKERVEILKEMILKKTLLKEGGEIPEWMDDDQSEDSSDAR